MKKLVFLAISGVCLIACNNSANTETASSTSGGDAQAQKNLATNRDIYKGIETGDSTKFYGIADDGVDHDGPNGQEMKGGNNIKKFLTDMHNHVDGLKFDITQDAAGGDYVFVYGMFHGTAKDNTMGAPAGTKMDSHFVDVLKFNKDGKATDHWEFADQAEMMKMMQNMPQQNAPNNKMKTDSAAGKM